MVPGSYHFTVSRDGFRTRRGWVDALDQPSDTTVILQRSFGEDTSDERGRFSIVVRPGRYDIIVELNGFVSVRYPNMQISSSRGVKLEPRLRVASMNETTTVSQRPGGASGGRVEGVVTDQAGSPIPGATVVVVAADRE
jgi:hypothetical protein